MSESPAPYEHVVSISGGKDSTALYLLALDRMQTKGRPFVAVFADTGNEHEWTYDFVRNLARVTNGPEPIWVRADFTADMERRRAFIARRWPLDGIPEAKIARAIELMQPTGNPFLDLCLMKGLFPSTAARFCTEELKIVPMYYQVQRPILQAGRTLVSWQGVRAQESLARRDLPRWQRIAQPAPYKASKSVIAEASAFRAYAYRPLIDWKVEEVFEFHRKHGVRWNPLYDAGMNRVGCMPCIMCKKSELREIASRFPGHVDRIAEWETLVSEISKRGATTFFDITSDPVAAETYDGVAHGAEKRHGIRNAVEWSKTSRGGRQYDMKLDADEAFGTACNTWGACE